MKKENIRIKWLNQLLKRHDSSMEMFNRLQEAFQTEIDRRKKIIERMDQLEDRLEKIEHKVLNQTQNDPLSRIDKSLHTMGVDTKGLKYKREDLHQR